MKVKRLYQILSLNNLDNLSFSKCRYITSFYVCNFTYVLLLNNEWL